MNQDDIAVSVQNVSKIYHLWNSRKDRLVFPLKRFASAILPKRFHKNKSENHGGYREFHALNNVSLDIKKGESWAFIGVNGSGKSTLLKIISGNLKPSAGRVEVDGKVVILDYGSGFNGEFTGRENIYIKASIMGLTRKQINERYQSIVDFAEIGDFINQPVRTYSSGMMSRLGFAIMAHVDADIIITDEALAVGDIFFVQKCMKFIRSFLEHGTFLFVSHSMNDVMSLCEHAVWLENGVVKEIGSASDVAWSYLEHQAFGPGDGEVKKRNRQNKMDVVKPLESDCHLKQPEISKIMNYNNPVEYIDMRLKYPIVSDDRNDIQITFPDLSNESGNGSADILSTRLCNEKGDPCICVVGSELVKLSIDVLANRIIEFPLVGFQALDKSGQVLFADNTDIIVRNNSFSVKSGEKFTAEFVFQMPLLPPGDYVFRVAVACGDRDNKPIMLDVINNAILLHCITSGVRHGLVGVPMKEISLKRVSAEKAAS